MQKFVSNNYARIFVATQRGNGPPFYPATAMQPTQNPIIQIYPIGLHQLFTIEFIHPDTSKIIGHVHTKNINAVKRILIDRQLINGENEAHLSIGGFTLNEAYEALEYEFINQ
jgi:hypothetical protein